MTHAEHAANFKNLLHELNDAYENEDYEALEPLCIDTRITKRIFLGIGGPTEYIDIPLDAEGENVLAGYYVRNWGPSDHNEYQLLIEEAEEVARLYGIIE